MKSILKFCCALALGAISFAMPSHAEDMPTVDETREIAKEGYIFGFPMVVGYKLMHAYAIDENSPEFKGHFNDFNCEARLYTPDDRAVVTPNADTPYCMNWLDLGPEPLVLSVPEMPTDRYYSFQLIDLHSYNFAYIGTLTTGNTPGHFLLAGPGWDGVVPDGITDVLRSEARIIFSVGRTQLFGPEGLETVKQIQNSYLLKPLSAYADLPKPSASKLPEFPDWEEGAQFDERFFNYLDVVLSLIEPADEDKPVWNRLARIGVGTDAHFDQSTLAPEVRTALKEGVAEGLKEINEMLAQISSDPIASGKIFGTRDFLEASAKKNFGLDNPYLIRAVAAHIGLYGNSAAEALYPTFKTDANGQPLNGAQNDYRMVFKENTLPPVRAFWSITMYDAETQLLVDNPIDRYLLNSSMLDQLKKGADGSITIYVQKDSPGKKREANWLPAANGPFYLVMRLYGPKPEALEGKWTPPPLERNN